jgi:lipoprotein-anchoring transpeptidase ErfK/SrfK
MRWLFVAVVAVGCGSSETPQSTGSQAETPRTPSVVADAAVAPPPYPADVTSLRLRRSIVVRFEPRVDAKQIGTIEEGTRVQWKRAQVGPGCPRWIEIEPRGWICDKYLEPTNKPPLGEPRPKLAEGEIVPGVYGKVAGSGAVAIKGRTTRHLAGSVTVRKMADVEQGGRKYWKTSSGELIPASKIILHTPSTFAGVPVESLPIAWAQSRKDMAAKIPVREAPDAKAKIVDKLAPRTVLVPGVDQGAFTSIGDGRWVATTDLHVARTDDPPDDLDDSTPQSSKWIDVDLDQQIAVAYEGRKPVYATMVASGNPKWPTPAGVYRIWLKFDETDMNGQMGDEQAYSVATVPWTMFFARDFAFHTAYWHDRFGEARSHGCVNVSPRDARWLWEWAAPDVPAGWSMSGGISERPGSLVKIHSATAPAPEYRGYAKVVHEARISRLPMPEAVEPEATATPVVDAGMQTEASETRR